MTRKLTTLFLALNAFGILLPAFGEEMSARPVEVVQTERASFAPGGVIHVPHSFGTVTVEGWDRPEVEITVVKSRERYYEPQRHEQAARGLERVRIVAERQSDSELTISTIAPHKRFPYLWGGKAGVKVEYLIHAPRDSRLVIQHGAGYVLVSNMTGDVEATSHGGDILLMLPDSGTYSIDARSKLGSVSSDFAGASHRRYLVGSAFARATSSASHRIYLRTRIGGITIKSVPVEALSKMPDSCVRRKTGTATNSRLWNWLAVPGLPTADTPPVARPIFIPPDEVLPHNATDTPAEARNR